MEFQVDIGSAQNINISKYLTISQETVARLGVPNKADNFSNPNNLNVRKHFVDIRGVRYSRDAVSIECASIDCLY